MSLSSLSQTSKNICTANFSLHVLVMGMAPVLPLGCVQDIESLRLLAEASGKNMTTLRYIKLCLCGTLIARLMT